MSVDTQTAPPPQAAEPGPVATRLEWATVPRVNLLPPEVLADRRFRRLQLRLAAVLAGTVVVSGAAVLWAQSGVASAEDALAATKSQTSRLETEQARYAEVPKALAELDGARAARETAMATDVPWYTFLSDLALNTPADTVLSSVSIAMTGGSTSTGQVAPLTPAGLGEVKVTGKAVKFTDVAAWLDAVGRVHGLSGSSLESATKDDQATGAATITYSGTVVITSSALSHRYDRKGS